MKTADHSYSHVINEWNIVQHNVLVWLNT